MHECKNAGCYQRINRKDRDECATCVRKRKERQKNAKQQAKRI